MERVLHFYPQFKETFALIGNLRSSFGINILLYNLALNPTIKHLIIWAPDKLSNTPIGITGKNTLLSLWKNQLDDISLVPEIDREIVDTMITNITLTDFSDQPTLDINVFTSPPQSPYMDKVFFPEFIVKSPSSLPSEKYMFPLRSQKGAGAYLQLLHTIWKYGQQTPIDTGGEDLKEIKDAVVVIEQENPEDIYIEDWLIDNKEFNITKDHLENYYTTQFCDKMYKKEIFKDLWIFQRPPDYSYLYAELLYAFPRQPIIDQYMWQLIKDKGYEVAKTFILSFSQFKDTKKIIKIEKKIKNTTSRLQILLELCLPAFDQINYVIERIKRKKEDLDKEIILWDQRFHTQLESGRPCLIKLSFIVRNNVIDVHAYFRSHDIGRAWFYNYYGICRLLGKIARETGCKTGQIVMESQSAQLYKRDWDSMSILIKKQVEEKPARMFFDPLIDSDPRGIVVIDVIDRKIKIKLQDLTTGNILKELEGRTAREMLYLLKHWQFISRTDHAAFIGSELAKAEICIKLGLKYRYDNPIELPNGEKVIS